MESQAWFRCGFRAGILVLFALCSLRAQVVSFFPVNEVRAGIRPSSLVVGDFNGDGRSDLAVTDETSGTVLVLLGVGGGFFLSPVTTPVGLGPRAVASGDFNRDGRLDLVVANFLSNTVWVLLGNG